MPGPCSASARRPSATAFRALTCVQGVGGRLALAILSVLSPDELARAVAQDDKAMIGRANGVGPKLAARIANELQGKLGVAGSADAVAAPRAAPPRTRFPRSPTSVSNPPKRAPRSTPRRTNSAPTPTSTRWSGWRCEKRRSDGRMEILGDGVEHLN